MVCPLKNAPSQIAQYETPLPAYSISPGTSSFTGVPPAVTITAGERYTSPFSTVVSKDPSASLCTFPTRTDVRISAPNFVACELNFSASSQPRMCSKPM